MILDGLLFKIIDTGSEEHDTVLCTPTSRVHILLDIYHFSIMGSNLGITKLSDNKQNVLLPKFGRTSQSIHNRMSHMPIVQKG